AITKTTGEGFPGKLPLVTFGFGALCFLSLPFTVGFDKCKRRRALVKLLPVNKSLKSKMKKWLRFHCL
ncbi:hypothetical protein CBP16_07190, partial [Fischerella thermalis WC217]